MSFWQRLLISLGTCLLASNAGYGFVGQLLIVMAVLFLVDIIFFTKLPERKP